MSGNAFPQTFGHRKFFSRAYSDEIIFPMAFGENAFPANVTEITFHSTGCAEII